MLRVMCMLLCGLSVVATLHVATAAATSTDEVRARALYAQLRCEVCEGQSLAGSNARLAVQMRELIRAQIEQGRSDDDILRYFTERYGEDILMRPPLHSYTLMLWAAPAAFLTAGLAALGIYLRRQSRKAA